MNLSPILALLQQRIGLDPGSLGPHAVAQAVQRRLRESRLDLAAYTARLADDPEEFAALIDEVVVPETWFFRGGEIFRYLAEHARALMSSRPGPFRALSVPCSTGGEPYSLAIALAEAGVPPARFTIDGIDLSPRHIEAARRGVFSELAFRQTPDAVRRRYFRPLLRDWEIDPAIRQQVRFRVGNLLDPGFLALERPYDLVFCRNLFIYLTSAARQQGREALARLVAPGGLLATGHAEPLGAGEERFERYGPEGYFLYRRRPEVGVLATRSERPLPEPFSPEAGERGWGESAGSRPQPEPLPPGPPLSSEKREDHGTGGETDPLHRARQEADRGHYDEALALCQEAERRFGPSADLYTLMGILRHARRDDAAASRYFTRALYLAPEHREALMHLMLLSQLQGAHERAAALRRRLERLPPENSP